VKHCICFKIDNKLNFTSLSYLLREVEKTYPNFPEWLDFNFKTNKKERYILAVYLNKGTPKLIGVSLIKKSKDEHKICTLFLLPKYRNLSIGSDLLNCSINLLNTKDIYITIPEEQSGNVSELLASRGFCLYETKRGVYKKGVKEQAPLKVCWFF